ncbi:Pentatricopeptide repeat-containing protein [Nymphaea thermarum]|nr:Pentatricopeptide repeat-containing protein [Nymphaea thermarum]
MFDCRVKVNAVNLTLFDAHEEFNVVKLTLFDAEEEFNVVRLRQSYHSKVHLHPQIAGLMMIEVLAMHGHGVEAVKLFYKMVKSGIEPDSVTFVAILYACSHAGDKRNPVAEVAYEKLREAALAIAEMEKAKSKAAIEAAEAARRLNAEMKAKKEAE